MKERLHPFQIIILIYMIQSGVGLFSLPNKLANTYGTNGWIGIFILSIIAIINISLIAFVVKLANGKDLFQLYESVLPKILIYPLYALLAFQWGIFGIFVTNKFILLLKMLYFPTVSTYIFTFMLLLLTFMLVKGGIYHIGKATVIFFYLTIGTTLLLFFHLKEFRFLRMTTFIFKDGNDFIIGNLDIFFSFLGYELVLLLIPFVEASKKWMRYVVYGNLLTTLVYGSVCFVSFGFFSYKQVSNDLYPVLTLLEYTKFPFVERIENLIFTLFAMKVLITIVMYYWASVTCMNRILPSLRDEVVTFAMIGITFLISLSASVMSEVDLWLKYLGYIETCLAFGLPLSALGCIAIIGWRN
ncbi:spore germination protein (amino acid permease) [Bacillus pakistanensis]|uniref:Spore germination protein (Amino acid permease) n=1 Tax=Rossellomorea pakistanensis TaxID=992288 RepID=A0ABS2N858_9BACI|nr:GerAB/ArcD/ProY family transporter [Bacillus pakistanensis]MBM7584018.1 spore germination protein (amino acid permease) [Bacillus pakistanensis]